MNVWRADGTCACMQLTAEDEERLAKCACWESIELPPIKVTLCTGSTKLP